MRALVAILMVVPLLAGCTDDDASTDSVDVALDVDLSAFAGADRLALLEENIEWHSDHSSNPAPEGAGAAYSQAASAVVNDCIWEGEPYFTNANVSNQVDHANVPEGTAAFEVTLSWTGLDYEGDSLYLAYTGGHRHSYRVSSAITNGEPTTVPVTSSTWDDGNGTTPLDIWLCISDEGSGVTAIDNEDYLPFHGNVQVKVDLLPVKVEAE